MQLIKRFIALVLLILTFSSVLMTTQVYAIDTEYIADLDDGGEIEENVENIDILNQQLDKLYKDIGRELNINYMYVKMLHLIAGGKAVYAETVPNIEVDTTSESLPGAFDIEGANQEYKLIAPWIECQDEDLQRPSKYYLPDAAYNVTASIIAIMNNRYNADRGAMQQYFDILDTGVKTNILFCEAVLQYTGSSEEAINSFYSVYERFLYEKSSLENIVELDENGECVFKDKYKEILVNNGISEDREIRILSCILRYDSKLAISSSTFEMSTVYTIPYKLHYTSRENLMVAAMSVVGKVKYVWGGGHGVTGDIEGINPMWELFYNSYSTPSNSENSYRCIAPADCWCPLHGDSNGSGACTSKSNVVYNIDQYLDERRSIIDIDNLYLDSYYTILENAFAGGGGYNSHRLDGLDCSGYMSWLMTQISSTGSINYDASGFLTNYGDSSIGFDEARPGDIYAWSGHVMMIVGEYIKGSGVYNIIEATNSTVKFGVGYYNGSNKNSLDGAKKLAEEANALFGNLPADKESTGIYNFDSIGGKLCRVHNYIDEYTYLNDYHKRIVDMTSREIMQHTANKLGYKYLSGILSYDGKYFDVNSMVSYQIIVPTIDEEEIVLNAELAYGIGKSLENDTNENE